MHNIKFLKDGVQYTPAFNVIAWLLMLIISTLRNEDNANVHTSKFTLCETCITFIIRIHFKSA